MTRFMFRVSQRAWHYLTKNLKPRDGPAVGSSALRADLFLFVDFLPAMLPATRQGQHLSILCRVPVSAWIVSTWGLNLHLACQP
jgi:hypothetical protein